MREISSKADNRRKELIKMVQEIEIEFKNLLTEEEFFMLLKFFHLKDTDFFEQENHYFDTKQFALKEHHSNLRIRHKDGKYILTLKEPAPVGILETHEELTEIEARKFIEQGEIHEGQVIKRVKNMGINIKEIAYFGSLSTRRAEKKVEDSLIVLDHSRYLNKEDYEIEFEVINEITGRETFLQLLQKLNIPIRETKNKVRRFYEEKYRSLT